MVLLFGIWACVAVAADVKQASPATPSRDGAEPVVQVTVISDGETWVSIAPVRVPAKGKKTVVKLPPGDYEVVGRRTGYREIHSPLQIRSGMAPISLTIICTEQANPGR